MRLASRRRRRRRKGPSPRRPTADVREATSGAFCPSGMPQALGYARERLALPDDHHGGQRRGKGKNGPILYRGMDS